MQFSFRVCFVLLLGLSSFINAQDLQLASPEAVGMSSERLERLTKAFSDYEKNDRMAGSVILLARKGKIFYYEAFGDNDIEAKRAMQKDAIFRIASQTKAVTCVGIMILQEEGLLDIHDNLSQYIPAFKNSTVAVADDNGGYTIEKAKRSIKIYDLLTYRAGIGYGYGVPEDQWREAGIQSWYLADKDETILEVVNKMAKLPNEFQPGQRWKYGYNNDILGAVIEVASGMPLDKFFEDRIFKPLGMTDTYFFLPKKKKDRLATLYSRRDGQLKRAPDGNGRKGQGDYIDGPRKCFSGGAGLLSTAMDYGKFLQMLLNNGKLNGKQILSRKSVELMTVNHIGDMPYKRGPGHGFGLGFRTVEDVGQTGVLGSEREYGWRGAYHSKYWVDPKEELIVVYFTQLSPTGGLNDHDMLRNMVYQAIAD